MKNAIKLMREIIKRVEKPKSVRLNISEKKKLAIFFLSQNKPQMSHGANFANVLLLLFDLFWTECLGKN